MHVLTAESIAELQHDLLTLREDLRKMLQDSTTGAQPVSLEEPIGRLSRIDALQQQSMTKATRETARVRLERIEAALRRHDDGTYGECLECEQAISYARLKAQPETLFCIECQGGRENRKI